MCQCVLFPGRDFCVGVWRDGNELNGLLRIRKCHKAERQVFTVDMVSFFSAKEDYKQGYFFVDDRKQTEGEG